MTSQYDPEGKLRSAEGEFRHVSKSHGEATARDRESAKGSYLNWRATRQYARDSEDYFDSTQTRVWTPVVVNEEQLDYRRKADAEQYEQTFWGEYSESDTRSVWDGYAWRLPSTTQSRQGLYFDSAQGSGSTGRAPGFYDAGFASWGYEGKSVYARFDSALGPASAQSPGEWNDASRPDMAAGPNLLRQDGGGGSQLNPGESWINQDEQIAGVSLQVPDWVQNQYGGSAGGSPGRNFGFELNLANTWAFTKGYHEGFYSDGLAGTASGLASGIQAGLGAVGSYISYAGTYWFWGEEAATQTEVGQAIDGLTVGAMTYGPEVARILGELQSGNYSPETVAAIQTAEALTKSVLNSIADELASKPEAERAHLAGRIAGAIQFEIVLAFATGGGALALSAATKAGKFANIAKKLEGFFSPQTVQRIMSALETALNKPVKANAPNRVAGLLDEAAETALLRGQAEEMAQMLARTQSNARRGPVLSLVRDRVTGEVFDAQNLSSIPSNLHPLLASRLESHLAANAGKLNPVWGVPGAHSEVWALNQALLRRESLGIGVQSLDDFSLYNVSLWRNRLGTTVPRCGNCNPITDGVRVLSGN